MENDSHSGLDPESQNRKMKQNENKQIIKKQIIMKKYMILVAVATLTLASCAKIDTFDPKPAMDDERPMIGFTSYTPRSLTKANDTYVSGTTLVENKQFAVYGWQTTGSFLTATPGTPAFMNPAVVTWTGDNTDGDANTYSPTRYWPSGDSPSRLSFTAYYPYGGAGITAPTFSNSVGTYAFTAQSTPATMVDFCVADVVRQGRPEALDHPSFPA